MCVCACVRACGCIGDFSQVFFLTSIKRYAKTECTGQRAQAAWSKSCNQMTLLNTPTQGFVQTPPVVTLKFKPVKCKLLQTQTTSNVRHYYCSAFLGGTPQQGQCHNVRRGPLRPWSQSAFAGPGLWWAAAVLRVPDDRQLLRVHHRLLACGGPEPGPGPLPADHQGLSQQEYCCGFMCVYV